MAGKGGLRYLDDVTALANRTWPERYYLIWLVFSGLLEPVPD